MSRTIAVRLGIASAIVFAIGGALWSFGWPTAGSPAEKVATFYADRQTRIVIGGALGVIGLALFAPFAAAVADLIARTNRALAITAAVGAGVLVTAGISAETINLAGAVRGANDPSLARILYELPQVFGSYTSGVGLGIFLIATGLTRLLPREWSAIVLVIGAALITPASLYVREFAGIAFVVTTLVVALALRSEDTEEAPPPPAP